MIKTIAVIDGNSLMHRAYHAIQTPMQSLDGTPTNAVFGFLQMFCKFVEITAPDAVVCAFDAGKPEHRLAELPEYKAQRPHMDDELRVQFPVIEELLAAMEVPVVKIPGWEGDDILGTIAARDEKLGFKTLLLTGDKDACQLATELTSIVNTKKGISDVAVLGPEEVLKKYGVSPDQFRDYLGLMGDTSDNIPGVPGVGAKTATRLLQEYGSIEKIYDHIDDLKGKLKENLMTHEDMAYLSRQIATIITDLEFPLDLEGISFPAFRVEEVEATFKKYSLMSPLTWVLRFEDAEPVVEEVEIDPSPLLEGDEAKDAIKRAIDQDERIGVAFVRGSQDTIFEDALTIAFATETGCARLSGDEAKAALSSIVREGKLSALDAKETLQLLCPPDTAEPSLLSIEEIFNADIFDLSLAAYDLMSTVTSYTYESLATRYLGAVLPESDEDSSQVCLNACLTKMLVDTLTEELVQDGTEEVYSKIDLPLVPVLVIMERTGVAIDSKRLRELGAAAQGELEALAEKIYGLAGEEFNIVSPKQLAHVLFEVMELTPIKKNQRGYSTDATVLKELAKTEEIAGRVLEYRELHKITSTYIDSLPKMRAADGRIHTVFHETVTVTGRLSSSDPNLQNIPVRTDFGRKIRECFIPLGEEEVFLSADYSQIELRLLAHLSQDEHLIEAFNSGADFHAMTASRVFGKEVSEVTPDLRSRAKAVNFGIVYGQQAYGLSQSLDIPFEEAKAMIDRYFEAYPAVRSYLDDTVKKATEMGYAETIFGRKRHIPELKSKARQQRGFGERTAMNHPMQGSAADIIKLAMIEVSRRLRQEGFTSKLLLQVHDELDFSVPRDEVERLSAMVREVMESVVVLDVPLIVDISSGDSWAQAH